MMKYLLALSIWVFASFSGGLAFAAEGFQRSMRVLLISPEQSRVFQTGGLAHAVTGLAEGLNQEGIRAEVLMPFYTEMGEQKIENTGLKFIADLDWREGRFHKQSEFTLHRNQSVLNPTLFLRHESGAEINYFDNRSEGSAKRYAPDFRSGESWGAFSKAAVQYILSQNYDLVILNDWTTGLIAALLAEAKAEGKKVPKTLFAVHNLAYQGLYPKSLADFLGLKESLYNINGYEYWGKMSFLKAGLQLSDFVYTVSPQYAEEISTPRFGAGLDGVIRERKAQGRVFGILNGISDKEWDPAIAKKGLELTFTMQDLSGKEKGKLALQKEMNWSPRPDVPVFILTSRMAEQKGFEYLIDAIEKASQNLKAQWVVIGDGESKYIERFKGLAEAHPEKVRYFPFSNDMEKKLTRYADFFVNGAWFEPSGLNQLFALKNGTIPVVSAAGGLLNSVKDGVTGFHFNIVPGSQGEAYDKEATQQSALKAFERAINFFKDQQAVKKMRQRGMAEDHTWSGRIRASFLPLFKQILGESAANINLSAPIIKTEVPLCSVVF